jgi:hypothetical protein
MGSDGSFSCNATSNFSGCTDVSTLSGRVLGPLNNPTGIECTEVNRFTGCCTGNGTYAVTASTQ